MSKDEQDRLGTWTDRPGSSSAAPCSVLLTATSRHPTADIQHKIWLLMMKGRLYWAPIAQPTDVLDIACGTGIWAIQLARQHPAATVTGTELSLIQPASAPANCTFIREDAEDPWVFPEGRRFDLVHLRAVCSCFADPRAVMQKAFDQLAPGGWCEYDDFAFEQVPAEPESEAYVRASPSARFLDLATRGLRNAGRDPQVARKYRGWMEEVGFVDVVEHQLLCPINGWPMDPEDRLLGQFMHLNSEKGVPSMVKVLLASGMPPEEVPEFLEEVKHSIADVKLRAYNVCEHFLFFFPFLSLSWCPFHLLLTPSPPLSCRLSRPLCTLLFCFIVHDAVH